MNSLLAGLGLPTGNFLYNYPAVLFGLVQYMLPFAVLLLVPAITSIASEVEMASESLGARWPQTFRHVVVPMAKPGLIGASVVVFTLTLTDFAMPEIMGGGTTDFIASAIYDSFFQISDAGLGSALAVILVLDRHDHPGRRVHVHRHRDVGLSERQGMNGSRIERPLSCGRWFGSAW